MEAATSLGDLLSYRDPVLRTPPEVLSTVYGDGTPYVSPGASVVVHTPEEAPPASHKGNVIAERAAVTGKIMTHAVEAPRPALPCPNFNTHKGCVEPCPKNRPHVKVCHDFRKGRCARKGCKFAHVICPYKKCSMGNKCLYGHGEPPPPPSSLKSEGVEEAPPLQGPAPAVAAPAPAPPKQAVVAPPRGRVVSEKRAGKAAVSPARRPP